jgi:hypothetical protein
VPRACKIRAAKLTVYLPKLHCVLHRKEANTYRIVPPLSAVGETF